MAPRPPPPALSAPGLVGPISILDQPISGPRSNRRARSRPYSHVRIEMDLAGPGVRIGASAFLDRLETLLAEREIVESADLLRLTAATLHALAARRFRWIEDWEIEPGGRLPSPAGTGGTRGAEAPVGDLLAAIDGGAWAAGARSRRFSVRVSDRRGNHVEAVVRRVHRQRRHALSLDLHGSWTRAAVDALTGSLGSRLPVSHTTLTKVQYE